MLAVVLLGVIGCLSAAAAEPPHLVFILSDDHGFHNVGFRNTNYTTITPTLDALADQGRVLERHYAYKM